MVDEGSAGREAPPDDRYYGPFGPQPEDYLPAEADPNAQTAYGPPADWEAPDQAPTTTLAPAPDFPPPRRRRSGLAGVIAVAAAVALLIGGGAGYGAARLAQQAQPTSAPAGTATAAPTSDPTLAPTSDPSATGTREPVPPAPSEADVVDVAKRTLPGTVMILTGDSTGSGFLIDREGRIVTNNHVVGSADASSTIRVFFSDGRRASASLVGKSPSYDLAVIKIDGGQSLQPLAIGDSDQTQVGQPVVAIGSPLGLTNTVTQGIVSAGHRPVGLRSGSAADAPIAYIDAIQTDASINPGNSGGPLVDAGARVIGVNSAIFSFGNGDNGLGFAIPINQTMVIANELIAKGRATYPIIGATLRDAAGGVELTSVEAKGPAGKAGLKTGDVITKLDSRRVSSMEELVVGIRWRRPGDPVLLEYERGAGRDRATVTLGSRVG